MPILGAASRRGRRVYHESVPNRSFEGRLGGADDRLLSSAARQATKNDGLLHLQGIVPAVVTPFRDDERIDFDAWQVLIDRLIGAGVNGIFAAGSSGEFYALDAEERLVAMRFCRQAVAGRVPLCVNVGAISTRDTVALAQQAEEIGVDSIAVATPYYVRPTQQEIADHYAEVCRAVRLPVLAYNFPWHGGVEILPETLARIAERCGNLAGIKDSSGNLEQTLAYRAVLPGRELAVFIGNDGLVLPALERGCTGAVAASANISPQLFVDLYSAFRRKDRDEAARLQAFVEDLAGTIGLHTFPAVIKEAMRIAGFPAGGCRKPIGPMPAEARKTLRAALDRLAQNGYLPTMARTVMG
jgi:4-hydroxy-tetrahydrodipicolinate synthase